MREPPRSPAPSSGRRFQRGFTYVGLLLAVALAGVALALAGQVWSTHAKREREAQLLFAGNQFREALKSYSTNVPVGTKPFPTALQELVEDRRGPVLRRHLRRLYADPMSGRPDWGLVRRPDGGIVGVYSRSLDAPLKVGGFAPGDSFGGAKTYAEWRFALADDTGGANPQQGLQPALPGAAAGPVVVEPPPEPGPVSISSAQLRRDAAERSSEGCDRIYQSDMAVCARLDERPGRAPRSVCEASASARQAACGSAGRAAMPALVTRPILPADR